MKANARTACPSILLAAALAFLVGCPSSSNVEPARRADDSEPEVAREQQPIEAEEPELEEGFSRTPQEVGEPTDGLTLQEIQSEAHDTFHRLVFELEGDTLPATRAHLDAEEPTIEIAMAGVRMDETGNRPLVNEAGDPFGDPVPVGNEPVVEYGRKLVLDDSLIAYEIRLSRPASFRLDSEGTTRVILDIATVE